MREERGAAIAAWKARDITIEELLADRDVALALAEAGGDRIEAWRNLASDTIDTLRKVLQEDASSNWAVGKLTAFEKQGTELACKDAE